MRCHPLFLPSILEAPDDDGPRLVYADWLDEQGDPELSARAEFIRLQCAMHPPRSIGQLERLHELFVEYESAWRKELPRLRGVEWGPYVRGFVQSVKVRQPPALARQVERIFTTAPVQTVTLLRLTRRDCRALSGWPLAWLSELAAINLGVTAEVLGELLRVSDWARLSLLELSHNPFEAAGTQVLAAAALPALRFLDLGGCGLGDRSVEALVAATWMGGLVALHVPDNRVGDAGVSALAYSPASAGMRRLFLAANHVGDAGARALAESPHLTGLDLLDLTGNLLIGPRGRQALRERFGGRLRL